MFILSICVVDDNNYFELTDPSQVITIKSILHGGGAIIIFIHVSLLFSICFIQVSQLLNSKDHALFGPVLCLNHVLFLPTYIYLFSLYTWCIPLYSLSSFTQYSVAKSREGVVRGILYERTLHTFIPYIALNSLIERPRSLVREIYGSPHIPF